MKTVGHQCAVTQEFTEGKKKWNHMKYPIHGDV